MAEFVCRLGTEAGRVLEETRQAASEDELRHRLSSEGFYVFSISPKRALRLHAPAFAKDKIRADEFLIFNEQFMTLSKSGLPLQKSLDLLAHQTRSEPLRLAIEGVLEKVRAGALLSEAFDAVGKFPKVYSATLRAGERSGNLDKVLGQYVTYQKVSRSFRKKLFAALIYPCVLLVFLAGLVTFVISFVVPRFAELYGSLDVALPELTVFLIHFSMNLRNVAPFVLAGVIAVLVFYRAASRSSRMRLLWDKVKYRLPVAGKLLLKFSVAEFARTLSTLVQGGIPVVSALETTRDSVSSSLLSQAIDEVRREVTGGRSLASAMRLNGFFPAIALDMVEVGETTGALPSMLEAVAEFFEEDVNIDLSTLISLVDPLMIGSIAIVVAFVLIAFYLPLFSLASQVH